VIARTPLLTLHRALLGGSRTASEEIATALIKPLTAELCRSFEGLDPALVSDGVTDAILEYVTNPQSFDDRHGVPLDRFLRKNAWRNVANTVRGEVRRQRREQTAAAMTALVELHPAVGNQLQDELDKRIAQHQRELAALPGDIEKQIQRLRHSGERRTAEFAKVLGIAHLPASEQRSEVKRAKDRIDKILCRKLKSFDEEK
jgi:hypothetical protein